MAENTKRHIFSIDGITGMLVATVLLIGILIGLTWWGIVAQQEVADKPYKITDPSAIEMIDKSNSRLKVIKE